MNETTYKAQIVEGLQYHGWSMQAHEDKHENYIPDLSFANKGIDGWIEVKYCETFPTTLDAIDHWTHGQEQWLINRGRAGSGHCFLWVGLPGLHVVWRYGTLSMVRGIKLDSAVKGAWRKDYTLPGLLAQMNAEVRRR